MKLLLAPILILISSLSLIGQDTVEISGEVISKNGIPLPGTNVLLHNTTTGAVTNACGQFKLNIPKDKVGFLSFSMISLPFYFDLSLIKDEDLDKGLVFRVMNFKEDKRNKANKEWEENITINCKEFDQKVTFKLTSINYQWPEKKTE